MSCPWKYGQSDLYFMVQGFFSFTSKTVWCMKMIAWNKKLAWLYVWPQNKRMLQGHILYGPVILPCTFKNFLCMKLIVWDNETVKPGSWLQNKRPHAVTCCRVLVRYIIRLYCHVVQAGFYSHVIVLNFRWKGPCFDPRSGMEIF